LLILFWRRSSPTPVRLRQLALGALLAVIIAAIAFLPFGSPWALALRLWREAGQDGGFSPTALVILAGREWSLPVPVAAVTGAATAAFALAAGWLLWRCARGGSAVAGAAAVFAAYCVQAFRFRIWYSAWPIPFLLLDPTAGRRLAAGLWFLLTAQLSVVAYGHLRVFWLGGDQLLAHLIGVPFTFVLPLLLARFVSGRAARLDERQRER
jgi:hypothetical protein